jgi:hypothetical protein
MAAYHRQEKETTEKKLAMAQRNNGRLFLSCYSALEHQNAVSYSLNKICTSPSTKNKPDSG